ncbi:MAG: XRE family transcriptional regulator [Candidatus Nomurabacteria bacterium GW2011_GWA2_40_9]|uniref:XRE family transcriptional regulator n=1 Tax=Candidatus Nomurabacteria bacterium GW2011_GWA2_40_9 TaxID=1618734 RepID=A0A0G0TXR5_9BACT|nr:MAG: XRE family transcriptional regulator [Candidatus Nomurabacteria bacterium GW2011_GWA2_40_9]
MKKIKAGKNKILKLYTFDEVFAKSFKSEAFQGSYNEELARLKLSNQIKHIRLEKDLTQKDLAGKAQMPQSVIARIESGTHSFSIGTLNRIARVFNKELELV